MTFYIKLLWYISVLGFLIILFGTYRNLAPEVTIVLDSENTMGSAIDRNLYFYGCVGFFLVFSIVFNVLINLTKATPKQLIAVPNKQFWFSSRETRATLYATFERWFYAILCVVNLFLMLSMLIMEKKNHMDGPMPYDYSTFYTILIVIFGLTLISLPVRLLIKSHDLIARQ
jgi:hypothetical protein